MTPGAYRALKNASVFLLALPPGYRAAEVLAYYARDAESPCERSEGHRIWKALLIDEGPCMLEISIEREGAWCRVYADRVLSSASMAWLHTAALRMLGLNNDIAAFEKRVAADPALTLFGRRRGMRVPTIPTGFDGLCWAIIGQQINLKFAASLRREIIHLGGERIGGMIAHPSAARVADIGIEALARRRFSRSKASYLIGAATAVAEGRLAIETLPDGSAVAAENALTAIRGVGTWTARYAMLRGGFADCAPVGDSALATALQRLHGRSERPTHDDVHRLMEKFAPHRSLATAHLWASLKDAAKEAA
jgi:AraC family transcriptional regulator of adaptative response / DNA-3-methyladenine glycosylase II